MYFASHFLALLIENTVRNEKGTIYVACGIYYCEPDLLRHFKP